MIEVTRTQLLPGVHLTAVQTQKFKSSVLGMQFLAPLAREAAALNALLPAVLRRGTAAHPDMESLSAALDELYAAFPAERAAWSASAWRAASWAWSFSASAASSSSRARRSAIWEAMEPARPSCCSSSRRMRSRFSRLFWMLARSTATAFSSPVSYTHLTLPTILRV